MKYWNYSFRSYYWRRRRAGSVDSRSPSESVDNQDQPEYHRIDSRRRTMSFEISNEYRVPLSRIMGRITGQRRNTGRTNNRVIRKDKRSNSSEDTSKAMTMPRRQVADEDIDLRYRSPTMPGGMMNIQVNNLLDSASKTNEKNDQV